MRVRSGHLASALVLFHLLSVYVLLLYGSGDSSTWWHGGSAVMSIWATAPHLVLLLSSSLIRRGAGRGLALVLLWLFATVGLAILTWGLVLNPGDYNHLVVIFLPIHQFEFLIVVAVAAGLVRLVRRTVRGRTRQAH